MKIGKIIPAALAACLLAASAIPAQGAAAVKSRWLSVSKNTSGARYVVDAEGKPFHLFGMARCQYHSGSSEDPVYFGIEGLTEHFKAVGCNTIRLAVNLTRDNAPKDDLVEACGGYNEKGIQNFITQYVDPDVQAIIEKGMYIMLDLHEYPPGDISNPDPAHIIRYAREKYIPIWRELAKRYRDEPMIAVYELWNEPFPGDQGSIGGDQWVKDVRQFFIDCAAEVRKYDQRHILLISDHNAGWGTAWPTTWQHHRKQVDPVYQNILFSIHVAKEHMDTAYNYYGNWWADTSASHNVGFLFGEIETEGDLMNTAGMQNLTKMFNQYKNSHHYAGYLWRPHDDETNYVSVWKDFAKGYTTKVTQSRWNIEAEAGLSSQSAEGMEEARAFGRRFTDTVLRLKADAKAGDSAEVQAGKLFPAGTYEMRIRTLGNAAHNADFSVGYRTQSGKKVELTEIKGRTANDFAESVVTFTAQEKFYNLILTKKSGAGKATNYVDRIVLRTDAAVTAGTPPAVSSTPLSSSGTAVSSAPPAGSSEFVSSASAPESAPESAVIVSGASQAASGAPAPSNTQMPKSGGALPYVFLGVLGVLLLGGGGTAFYLIKKRKAG